MAVGEEVRQGQNWIAFDGGTNRLIDELMWNMNDKKICDLRILRTKDKKKQI